MNKHRQLLSDCFSNSEDSYVSPRQLLCGLLSFSKDVPDPEAAANLLLEKYATIDNVLSFGLDDMELSGCINDDAVTLLRIVSAISARRQFHIMMGTLIRKPEDACRLFENAFRDAIVEELRYVCLNNRFMVAAYGTVATGDTHNVGFDRSVLLKKVKMSGCNKCIIAHNHPGAAKTPSEADKAVTNELKEVFERIGVTLLEHIVVGSDGAECLINNDITRCFPR